MSKINFIFGLLFLGLFIAPGAWAEMNWPPSPGFNTPLNENSDLTQLIEYLYEWGISLGGLAAFIALVAAGFKYLTSAGDPGKMKEAMDWIKSASLGLALLLSSVLILNTINPQLTTLKMPALLSTFTEQCAECKDKWNENEKWKTECRQECYLMEGEIKITQKCDDGAIFYNNSDDCQGDGQLISENKQLGDILCSKNGGCSIKTEENNLCKAEFHDTSTCFTEPMTAQLIGNGCLDFGGLYFDKDVSCIKIRKP